MVYEKWNLRKSHSSRGLKPCVSSLAIPLTYTLTKRKQYKGSSERATDQPPQHTSLKSVSGSRKVSEFEFPNEKEYGVAQMARRYSIDAIKREIAKCIVVCANCHRKVHAGKISPLSVVEAYQSSKLLGWDRNPEGILQE